MTFPLPRPRTLLGVATALAALALGASPALALPGVGVDVGAGVNYSSDLGTAFVVNADASFLGPTIGLLYWQTFLNGLSGAHDYGQVDLRMNMSPIPMITVAPGIAACTVDSAFGGLVTLNAGFAPLLLPVSVDAMIGAGYAKGGLLLPYNADLKLSLIPFTAIKLGWRGWAGASLSGGGPEAGLEIGF